MLLLIQGLVARLAAPAVWRIAKPVLIVVAIGAAVWFAQHKWNNYKEGLIAEGYRSGYSTAESEYAARTRQADEQNRAVEKAIGDIAINFGEAIAKQRSERIETERVIIAQAEPQIAALPTDDQCAISQDLVEARNAIRDQGPEVK